MSSLNEWLGGLTSLLHELAHRQDEIGRRAEGLGQFLPTVRNLVPCGWDNVAGACVAAECRCHRTAQPAAHVCRWPGCACARNVCGASSGRLFYDALRGADPVEFPDEWDDLTPTWHERMENAARAYGASSPASATEEPIAPQSKQGAAQ